MDNNLIIILLIALIVLIAIFILLLGYYGQRFLKLKERNLETPPPSKDLEYKNVSINKNINSKASSEVLESLRANSKAEVPSIYCSDHPDEYAVGKCAICGDSFCEHCLSKQGDVKIAKKYLDLYLDFEWDKVFMLHNNEKNQNLKDIILEKKKKLWNEKAIPMIVQGHYKINVQNDEIEQYTVVLSRIDDKEMIKKQLEVN